tara:strand:- start:139 stop:1470 length:1332 start_codon:yes stop_codon:yes gene_type:complete
VKILNKIIQKTLIKIYLIGLFYFLVFDYKYFGLTSLFIFSIYVIYKNRIKINYVENFLLKFSPLFFYSKKLLIGIYNESLWEKTFFDLTIPFADFKLSLSQLICQGSQAQLLSDGFMTMDKNCPYNQVRYGPLFHLIEIPNSEIYNKLVPIVLYFLFFLLFIKFRSEINLNEFEINLLVLSPIINQLLSQLNIDIILYIIFYFFVKLFPQKIKLNLIVFFLLALIKFHPIGLLIGYLFLARQKKINFIFNLASLTLFIFILFYFIQIDSNFLLNDTPRPSGLYSANGLLTISQFIWINYLDYAIGYRVVIFIFLLLGFLLVLLLYFKKQTLETLVKQQDTNEDFLRFTLLGWIITLSIYANFDYRYAILIFIFTLIKSNRFINYFFIGLFLVSPIPILTFELLRNLLFILKMLFFTGSLFICLHIFVSDSKNILSSILRKLNY